MEGFGKVEMTQEERRKSVVLIVEPDDIDRDGLRSAFQTLGYKGISCVADHASGLKKHLDRHFTHVVFSAKDTNISAKEFLSRLLRFDKKIIAIPTSSQPSIDNVFRLLQMGARGFLAKPFTAQSVDDAVTLATKGDPICEELLHVKDCDEAFAAMMATRLDIMADTLRDAERYEIARKGIQAASLALRRSVELAKAFSEGGEDVLLNKLEEFCLKRSEQPATKLGRLRKKLQNKRRIEAQRAKKRKQKESLESQSGSPNKPKTIKVSKI